MNKTRLRILEEMLIHKEKIKSEDSSLRVENTVEGLRASISRIESQKIEQATETGNLIDNEWESGNLSLETGITVDTSNCIRTKNFQKVYPNHLYKISRTIATNSNGYRFYDKNFKYLGNQITENITETNMSDNRMNANQTSMEMTILNTDVAYMKMVDLSNDSSTIYTMTTEAINTDYPSNIEGVTGDVNLKVQNKNYVKLTDGTLNLRNTSFTRKNGILEIEGTTSGGYSTYEVILNLPKGNYIFNGQTGKPNNSIAGKYIRIYNDSSSNYVNYTSDFKITGNEYRIKMSIVCTDGITYNETFAPQIERNIQTDSFVEHKEKNFTVSLGDKVLYKGDKIIRKDGKWFAHHEWNKLENPIISMKHSTITSDQKGFFQIILNDKYKEVGGNGSTLYCKCNYLSARTSYASDAFSKNLDGFWWEGITNAIYLILPFERVEEAQEWINENGVYLIYKLSTPTDTEITDEILISQLDKILMYLFEYDDITNFDFDSDVTFEITVEKDRLSILENRLNNAEQNTTNAQILALESED